MKKTILLSLMFAASAAFALPDNRSDFKIMSYNIRHGHTMENKLDLSKACAVINAEKPRFAGIQEVDQLTDRVGGADTAKILSERTGMHATFAKAIPLGSGEYGVVLLSREKPLSVIRTPLPGGEPRVLLLCEFEDCWAGTTHLDLNAKRRLASADVIGRQLEKCKGKPVFITGDWNATPDAEETLMLKKNFAILSPETQATYHGGKTNLTVKNCIDYIGVTRQHRGNYILKGRRVIPDAITSDHFPVVVTVAPADKCQKREGQFTIASFNVRCPGDQNENSWKLRMPRVAKVIRDHGFDIFGVQEAIAPISGYFDGDLADFDRIGCGRNADRTGESMFIFFNRNRFKCLDSGTFWLSDEPEKPGSRYPGAGCPRTCTWGLFEDLVTGKQFRYFNTHLDHISQQARINGVEVLFKNGLQAAKGRGETVLLTGDMNAMICKDDSLETLAKIRKTDLAERAKTNPIAKYMTELTDAVEISARPHEGSWLTNHGYRPEHNWRIDYIYVTPDVKVLRHATLNDRPDGNFPSDHDPVAAVVEL